MFSFYSLIFLAQTHQPVCKELTLQKDSVYLLDSLSINPYSFFITHHNDTISPDNYILDFAKATLIWKSNSTKKVTVCYRRFPLSLSQEYYKKDTINKLSVKTSEQATPLRYQLNNEKNDWFGNYGLNKSGSISRGVMFGSAQDLSLNSNLNLQLSGKISDDIEILASITDDNLPIQPDGNTQQLNDFDQVYIQLFSKDKWRLQAGDFWIKNPKNYFLRYNKRLQGASFYKKTTTAKDLTIKNSASIAISKGKFSRQIIQGEEGNQGPYRLQGASGERFIVVLSGTERVFIDGKLLKRGTANDYIIDYNTAEVVFTPNQIITKDKRIIIEFQYSDKNYARSIIENTNEFISRKSRWYFNVYSEQDAKNQPLQQNLSDEEKQYLSTIGDSLSLAYFPSEDSVEFSPNQVLYKKIDSLGYSIYIHSSSPDSAFYNVVFSKVQTGGNYILSDFSAFGKIYKWIAPDTVSGNIIHKGDYAPVKVLITPQKSQLITLGTEQNISRNTTLNIETALSNRDINTFSPKDNNDNLGYGLNFALEHKKDSVIKSYSLTTSLNTELISTHFNPVEWYRSPEFIRDWNVGNTNLKTNQFLSNATLQLHNKFHRFSYGFSSFLMGNTYKGYKNSIAINSKGQKGFFADITGSLLNSFSRENTQFIRHEAHIYQTIKKWKIGFQDIHENNRMKQGDSLLNQSYQFYDWRTYISTADTTKTSFSLFYGQRSDKAPANNRLTSATFAQNTGGKVRLLFSNSHQLNINLTYRELLIKDTSVTSQRPENTLLGRLNHQLKIAKGGIRFSTFYEIGSGLELKKEFTYIEVVAGQGTHTWIDYNDNGIKELNEFEIASFPDQAQYIKVFTPSATYIKTYNTAFNEVININPRYFLKKKNKFNKLINRFSSQTALRTQRKSTLNSLDQYSNPFANNIADSSLQTLQNSLRNSLYFNRSNPKFGTELSHLLTQNKTLLANGFDSRSRENYRLKIRWNITKSFLLQLQGEQELKTSKIDYAPNRNYNIQGQYTEAKLSYQPSTKFRLSVSTQYKDKQNQLPSAEKAFINDYGVELKYNRLSKGIITASFNYINNKYTGEENSTIAFEMLEALQKGTNYTWNCSIQKTLANNLQLTINYTGRKSSLKTIHTGGVQARAFF